MQIVPTASDAKVDEALAALCDGGLVLVVDDASRENEGDLVVAAEFATAAAVNTMISEGRGLLCVAAEPTIVSRLELPQMVATNTDSHATAFTVSVDACGTGTGISAADRAATIRALAAADTRPGDLRRPGHIFPLRAVAGGVLERRGHTEASVELARLAGLTGAAAICEVLDEQGRAADRAYLERLAERLRIPILDVADIVACVRARHALTGARLPTRHGCFTAIAHRDDGGVEHLALVLGDPAATPAPLVRVHSECLTGDVVGSRRCDCGDQLDLALAAIAEQGVGAVVYLRGHEGRGIGLLEKIRAYALQDAGCDTVDANLLLGHPVDGRDYQPAAEMLRLLGVGPISLLTNNPDKAARLRQHGVAIARTVPLAAPVHSDNRNYLETKRIRLGHELEVPPAAPRAIGPLLHSAAALSEDNRAC
ncbi:3,4-dihydroxy-2-butanone-4-phosphate synthase [Nocardia jiangxiensis]|uniref:GTP cyclohydrolase-2 n=1 Tax=Nocardia jiangxiensis TaxID=282685 RepID=A0ABW6RZ28_9NOCA